MGAPLHGSSEELITCSFALGELGALVIQTAVSMVALGNVRGTAVRAVLPDSGVMSCCRYLPLILERGSD